MGWYMDPNFDWDSYGDSAPACSISNKPKDKNTANESCGCTSENESPKASSASSKATAEESVSWGETPCLLPANSPPPPPPPNYASIYHLCLYSNWQAACDKGEPYFPPTFMADGKFTRATLHKADVVDAANEYYKDRPGEWVVLELNCKFLFQLGIPILAQDAPESSLEKPVKCLQIFGGISTLSTELVSNIYKMRRAADGTFLRVSSRTMNEPSTEEKDDSKTSSKAALEGNAKEKNSKRKGLFGRFKK